MEEWVGIIEEQLEIIAVVVVVVVVAIINKKDNSGKICKDLQKTLKKIEEFFKSA